MRGQLVAPQQLLAGLRLKGGKAEDLLFILADNKVDRTIAKVADAIE